MSNLPSRVLNSKKTVFSTHPWLLLPGRDPGGPAHTAAGDRDQEDEGARDYQVILGI
jgi:hypothetical protein